MHEQPRNVGGSDSRRGAFLRRTKVGFGRRNRLDREFVQRRLDEFLRRVWRTAEQGMERIPAARDDDLLRFAVGDLLPNRVVTACRFITEVSDSDVRHLRRFLTSVECAVAGEIAAADDAATVANAVVTAAEDLHNYLLGHDLVDARYTRLQSLPSSLFRRIPHDPIPPSLASWWEADRTLGVEARSADDSHEYALAA
jgi:hypothetical protein